MTSFPFIRFGYCQCHTIYLHLLIVASSNTFFFISLIQSFLIPHTLDVWRNQFKVFHYIHICKNPSITTSCPVRVTMPPRSLIHWWSVGVKKIIMISLDRSRNEISNSLCGLEKDNEIMCFMFCQNILKDCRGNIQVCIKFTYSRILIVF